MSTASKATLKALQIIHRAMLLGQIVFLLIVVFLKYSNRFPSTLQHLDQLLQLVALVLSFGGFFIGGVIFKKKLQQVKEVPDLVAKVMAYRSGCMIQWALLEAASFFCILCFLLVGNYAFLALSLALLLAFAVVGPSKLKLMLQLQLSEEELEVF
jgi:hypothetical protein